MDQVYHFQHLLRILSLNMDRSHNLRQLLSLVENFQREILHREEVEVLLPQLFEFLNSTDEEEANLSCSIVDKILPDINLERVFIRCLPSIKRAEDHPKNEVRCTVMRVLLIAAKIESLLSVICEQGLLSNAILSLFANEVLLTQLASSFLVAMSKNPSVVKMVLSGQPLNYLKTFKSMNMDFSSRVDKVVVEIALASEEGFLETIKCGLLSEIITKVKQETPLIQLHALDLMGTLAGTSYGFKYLRDEGELKYICDKFTQLPSDPSWCVLLPGYIQFCRNVTHAHPIEMTTIHPEVIEFMVRAIVTDITDAISLTVLLEAIAFIATTPEGKRALHYLGDPIPRLMANFQDYMRYLTSELQVRAMNAFADILKLQPEDQTQELLLVTHKWFCSIDETPLELIMVYCNNPFTDLELAGLKIMKVIAKQQWGVKEINKKTGLMEFLLERKMTSSKEVQEVKFEIITALLNSSIVESEFSETTLSLMKEYIYCGPFNNEAATVVSVEEKAN